MPRTCPAQDKALTFLIELISDLKKQNTSRLPNLSAISKYAGVNHITMLKVIDKLKDQGVLAVSHGKGITILDGSIPIQVEKQNPKIVISDKKWMKLAENIERRILTGKISQGSNLSSVKTLMKEYGVSYRTLDKAIKSLISKGFLTNYKRGYHIPVFATPQSSARIILIMYGKLKSSNLSISSRAQENLYILENECSKMHIPLEIVLFDFDSEKLHIKGKIIDSLRYFQGTTLGFIILSLQSDITSLLKQLSPLKKPVAILNDSGNVWFEKLNTSSLSLRFFSMAYGTTAGRSVATYLLGLGHKSIAYISPFHQSVWSKNRLQGLIDIYNSAGIKNGVHTFTSERGTLWEPGKEAIDLHEKMHLSLDKLEKNSKKNLEKRIISKLKADVYQIIDTEIIRSSIPLLMEDALAVKNVTAWVAANDLVAIECIEFLKSKGISIPKRISVIGFDNSHDSFLHKLTSYNFNRPTAMIAMLTHILKHQIHSTKHFEPIECEGNIVIRGSTSKTVG